MSLNDLSLGRTADGERVILSSAARMYNTHIIGRPNMGKSKLIAHMIQQDILAGQGVLLLDPHGTLYDEVVDWCVQKKMGERRTIKLIDPKNRDQVVGFNPFDMVGVGDDPSAYDLHKVAGDIVEAVASVWGDEDMTTTPLLNRYLTMIFYLLASHNLTLVEARALIGAPSGSTKATTFPQDLRKYLTQNIENPIQAEEWRDMQGLALRDFTAHTSSTLNRLNMLIGSRIGRTMLGQQENVIDFRKCADNQEVVLVDLRTDPATFNKRDASVLGTLMINQLVRKMSNRPAKISKERPLCVYIDECYRFLGADVATILDELRKRGVRLHVAHQRISQLEHEGSSDIKSAVMNLADNKIIFSVGAEDAREMADQVYLGRIDPQRTKPLLKTIQQVGVEKVTLHGSNDGTTESHGSGIGSADASESMNEMYDADGNLASSSSGSSTPGDTYSSFDGYGASHVDSEHEAFKPIYEEVTNQTYTHEEQMEEKAGELYNLNPQHALIHSHGQPHRFIKIDNVPDPRITERMKSTFMISMKRELLQISKPIKQIELEIDNRMARLKQGVELFTKSPDLEQDDDFSA